MSPSPGDEPPPRSTGSSDRAWRRFGLVLAGGVVVVVAYHVVELVGALEDVAAGTETGAVWTILLMIFVVGLTVFGIGGGLLRALRREGEPDGEPDDDPDPGRPRPPVG